VLDYLRKMHGGGGEAGKTKITITRKQTGEIRKTDSTGKSRTIQVGSAQIAHLRQARLPLP